MFPVNLVFGVQSKWERSSRIGLRGVLNGTVKWYNTYRMLLTNMFGGKYRKGQWRAAAVVDATDSLDKHS